MHAKLGWAVRAWMIAEKKQFFCIIQFELNILVYDECKIAAQAVVLQKVPNDTAGSILSASFNTDQQRPHNLEAVLYGHISWWRSWQVLHECRMY